MINIECHILSVKSCAIPPKPENCMRILQFSDVHLGLFPKFSQMCNKRALGALNHFFRRRGKIHPENISRLAGLLPAIKPDCIICTGDLSSVGLPAEFELAIEALKPLRDYCPEHFFYVPGNHDAYVVDALPYMAEAFITLNAQSLKCGLEDLPAAAEMEAFRLVLINGARPVNWFMSNGVIDARTRQFIDELLPASRPTFAVCHFPALTSSGALSGLRHGLVGADFMGDKLGQGVFDLVLSGHVHRAYQYSLENGGTQLCAGSLTLHDSYAIVDVPGAD